MKAIIEKKIIRKGIVDCLGNIVEISKAYGTDKIETFVYFLSIPIYKKTESFLK